MDEGIREEFQILNEYSEELKKALISKASIYVYRLLKIADHITLCNHLAKKTESENHIIHTSSYFWKKCVERWIEYKKVDPKSTIQLQSKKTWEEVITKDDQRFLKALRITAEIPNPDNNEDDCP